MSIPLFRGLYVPGLRLNLEWVWGLTGGMSRVKGCSKV